MRFERISTYIHSIESTIDSIKLLLHVVSPINLDIDSRLSNIAGYGTLKIFLPRLDSRYEHRRFNTIQKLRFEFKQVLFCQKMQFFYCWTDTFLKHAILVQHNSSNCDFGLVQLKGILHFKYELPILFQVYCIPSMKSWMK